MRATGASSDLARRTLESCGFQVKVAIVALKRGISVEDAESHLAAVGGNVRRAIGDRTSFTPLREVSSCKPWSSRRAPGAQPVCCKCLPADARLRRPSRRRQILHRARDRRNGSLRQIRVRHVRRHPHCPVPDAVGIISQNRRCTHAWCAARAARRLTALHRRTWMWCSASADRLLGSGRRGLLRPSSIRRQCPRGTLLFDALLSRPQVFGVVGFDRWGYSLRQSTPPTRPLSVRG